ncbi:hypothetical protein [Roseicella frigidaeris]|uniref:Type II restriction endonuclease n=1 Tax=Roseicella frigidaeris TaxID=2230885 RepID=A0A327LVV4_9PROT|nr:hypothetical protein [Roseicella frigidaeris]RAI54546.1 hypothetical protein DOO78_26195 [Roseicella frigidaeris]
MQIATTLTVAADCDADVLNVVAMLLYRWRDDPGSTYRSWFLWEERVKNFRSIRRGIQQVVADIKAGLGAVGGLLFDVGSGRYPAPPLWGDVDARAAWEADLARVREEGSKAAKALAEARESDHTNTEDQGWLRDLGMSLGYNTWVEANDRNRPLGSGRLGNGCRSALPGFDTGSGADAVPLIDVLWLDKESKRIVAAYEVEHITSIYSGIVRMLDLALGPEAHALEGMFLVAPDGREGEVREQLTRPAFSRVADLKVHYLPYGELKANRKTIARFGHGMKPIQAISRALV